MSSAREISADEFDKEVLQSDIPVLVDFWAVWCGPCRMIAPSVDQIADENAGKLKVVKVDIDNAPSIAGKYGIMSIPTLIVFKGGSAVETIVGALPKQKIAEKITPHLG